MVGQSVVIKLTEGFQAPCFVKIEIIVNKMRHKDPAMCQMKCNHYFIVESGGHQELYDRQGRLVNSKSLPPPFAFPPLFLSLSLSLSFSLSLSSLSLFSSLYLYLSISFSPSHSIYRVFIKYCVFEDFEISRTLAFLCFPSVSVCVHTPGR